STSVPGLAAKPVIDITIGVKDLAAADEKVVQVIVELGYEYVPDFEDVMPTRRYFRRSNAEGMRTHQIHLWQIDDPEYERHIVFRDYLRAHPDEATAYAELKRSLAEKFDSVNDYANAKTEFIREREHRAYAWRRSGL
ncbi:MAG: GrpB family protein, partial [Chloroflexi bacterium]|nr:GrpB family protein [Chloroflexota bacterium]